jgi:hypothetical protein
MTTFYGLEVPQDPVAPSVEEQSLLLRTRSGYLVADTVRSFKVALEQSGAPAAGKSLHYTADLVCSGCFPLWQKLLYDYAFDHIGIASPRIFWFLRRRFTDLEVAWGKLPAEQFYRTVEYQKAMAETLLILRSCPRRPGLKMPRVPPESHNEEWVRGATGSSPPSAAVGRVFRGSGDLQVLRRVGDEFAKSCADGATEKAFFWMKWLLEEDTRLRKDGGGSLSTLDRGPPEWTGKRQRSHVGFYIAALVGEIYKELASKHGLRMSEEMTAILQLFSFPNKQLSQKRRIDLLCLAIQIVCEVPRWKVPAAPALVKDPVALERAISHAESFFREVLAYDPPVGDVAKEAKKGTVGKVTPAKKQLTGKELKQMNTDEQLAAYNAAIDGFFGKL